MNNIRIKNLECSSNYVHCSSTFWQLVYFVFPDFIVVGSAYQETKGIFTLVTIALYHAWVRPPLSTHPSLSFHISSVVPYASTLASSSMTHLFMLSLLQCRKLRANCRPIKWSRRHFLNSSPLPCFGMGSFIPEVTWARFIDPCLGTVHCVHTNQMSWTLGSSVRCCDKLQ